MQITTKLNVGDKAFLLHNNKVLTVRIESIQINITRAHGQVTEICTTYRFEQIVDIYSRESEITGTRTESSIFATKEELLASL